MTTKLIKVGQEDSYSFARLKRELTEINEGDDNGVYVVAEKYIKTSDMGPIKTTLAQNFSWQMKVTILVSIINNLKEKDMKQAEEDSLKKVIKLNTGFTIHTGALVSKVINRQKELRVCMALQHEPSKTFETLAQDETLWKLEQCQGDQLTIQDIRTHVRTVGQKYQILCAEQVMDGCDGQKLLLEEEANFKSPQEDDPENEKQLLAAQILAKTADHSDSDGNPDNICAEAAVAVFEFICIFFAKLSKAMKITRQMKQHRDEEDFNNTMMLRVLDYLINCTETDHEKIIEMPKLVNSNLVGTGSFKKVYRTSEAKTEEDDAGEYAFVLIEPQKPPQAPNDSYGIWMLDQHTILYNLVLEMMKNHILRGCKGVSVLSHMKIEQGHTCKDLSKNARKKWKLTKKEHDDKTISFSVSFISQLANGSLSKYMAAGDIQGTPHLALDVIRQVAASIALIHKKGFVIQDLKADNYLVTVGEKGQLSVDISDHDMLEMIHTYIKSDIRTEGIRYAQSPGTCGVKAPEMFQSERDDGIMHYTQNADVWMEAIIIYAIANWGMKGKWVSQTPWVVVNGYELMRPDDWQKDRIPGSGGKAQKTCELGKPEFEQVVPCDKYLRAGCVNFAHYCSTGFRFHGLPLSKNCLKEIEAGYPGLTDLLEAMLDYDPENRPNSSQVMETVNGIEASAMEQDDEEPEI